MEFRHLRYFQAVAEELNFSRAARRLRVAQPALSRAVQEVEAVLGVSVLERSRHHVRLTPAGTVLLREAGLLAERFEEMVRRVKRAASGEEGELRLGYIGPPTQPFLGSLLREYQRRHPLVAVHLEERTPERVWEMVRKGRLTVGLTRPVIGPEKLGLKTHVLREEQLGVLVPMGHRLADRKHCAWKALEFEALILLSRREAMSLHDAVLVGCRKAGFSPRIAHTPSLIGTVMTYAESGAGLGVVTDSVVPLSNVLRLVLLRPKCTVPLVLVWHEDDDPPAARCFRQLVLDWNSQGLLWSENCRSAVEGTRLTP